MTEPHELALLDSNRSRQHAFNKSAPSSPGQPRAPNEPRAIRTSRWVAIVALSFAVGSVRSAKSGRQIGDNGNLPVAHRLGVHGIQTVPLVALVASRAASHPPSTRQVDRCTGSIAGVGRHGRDRRKGVRMLAAHPIDVMLTAPDLSVAKQFYADRIGLDILIDSVEVADYDEPDLKTIAGVADVGFALSAWFVDPGGNTIGLLQFEDKVLG